MSDDPLEGLFEALRRRSAPGPSVHFDEAVWKRIRAVQRARPDPWWDALARAFWQPRWVAGTVAVTLSVAVGFGRLAPAAKGLKDTLSLEAFSAEAPWLPSTLLTRAR